MYKRVLLLITCFLCCIYALNLDYLDPTQLQTVYPAKIQQEAATKIINEYTRRITVTIDPLIFNDKKDIFSLQTVQENLNIRASSGVAALWGFNYYLKKYCNSQIAWQVEQVNIPSPLPAASEVVVANDRFRYFQNVVTASYSFVWWDLDRWFKHVKWMAFNGINLVLAPVAQEKIWADIYRSRGMTQDEINEHFTGPAFLSWLRMGNVHGWGGPLPSSWHQYQKLIQDQVIPYMQTLGMVPVFPAFSGHVPKAFARLYPNNTFHSVGPWNKFEEDYCCLLFAEPTEQLFKDVGVQFLQAMTLDARTNHIYSADPFNEIAIIPWQSQIVTDTAKSIYETINSFDERSVWLVQNWMFVHDPNKWPEATVKGFLSSVPIGRMLLLDLQSEQWPQYNVHHMYYGQPFVWCMLHNFGGTLGMFGNTKSINSEVYEARHQPNSTMIGVGLTPEGINQNYVIYDLMLESAWRKSPVHLDSWIEEYAQRRYVCNATGTGWRHLLRSVYNFDGLNSMRGKYVVTRRPSFNIKPWAWYPSKELIKAWGHFIHAIPECRKSDGFKLDLVDVTRQALQYRAEQLYTVILNERYGNTWVFNSSIAQFLDIMQDMERILLSNGHFTANEWMSGINKISRDDTDRAIFAFNAKNQITLWGPNGEITDYACKQWAEVFHYYYTPRWRAFLMAALEARLRNEVFQEKSVQNMIRLSVESKFASVDMDLNVRENTLKVASELYMKWAFTPGLKDLPLNIIKRKNHKRTTLPDVLKDGGGDADFDYTVMMSPTTASFN